ncbi:hypothetical protein DL764_010606 [Monosporascus ibericus]|uniref:Uncharacterized protein n=1 Tax=Monosporascus ibericus TaxID=155417 RepID=A0A4Q4SSG3_9PEZI|nr:hypothetical protein DL764_010606 [Monosporascus ibericus]
MILLCYRWPLWTVNGKEVMSHMLLKYGSNAETQCARHVKAASHALRFASSNLNPETDEFWPQDSINKKPGYTAYVPSAHDCALWTVIPAYNGDMHMVQSCNHSLYGAGRAVEIPDMPDTVG